jgi:hypothetical protein
VVHDWKLQSVQVWRIAGHIKGEYLVGVPHNLLPNGRAVNYQTAILWPVSLTCDEFPVR